mgnify:CR=1 FL=1
MAYNYDQLAGLVGTTHTMYPKQELTITWDSHRYEAARIFNQESIKKQGGTSITGKAILSPQGNARFTGYYDKDDLAQGETLHTYNMPWCRFTTNWSWDELEIIQNKSDPEGFIDLAKVKEMQAIWDLANLFEAALWQAPTNANDDKFPRGIPYYIRWMNKDTTTAGWVGKTIRYRDTSTGTNCSGIDSNVHPQWCNWADLYTAVDDDLMSRLRKAFMYTRFKAPLGATQFEKRAAAKRRVYTSFTVKQKLFDYLDAKDDMHTTKEALGRMVVSPDGGTDMLINGHDVVEIDTLESQTDPETTDSPESIYCVDFAHLMPVVYSGYWMQTRGPVHGGTQQHTVFTMFKDGAFNILCDSPRQAGFVLHKALTA